MRYCEKCGEPLGNERFCMKCGADNGAMQNSTVHTQATANETINLSKSNIYKFLHWTGIVLLAISSVILLVQCCKYAESIITYSILYHGNCIAAVIYFILGMWWCIPSLNFIINGIKTDDKSVITLSVIMLIFMVVSCVLYAFFSKSDGFMYFFARMFSVYKRNAVVIIIMNILTAATCVLSSYFKK